MEDIEEDPILREKINIYLDKQKMAVERPDDDEELPEGPTLQEMLDDLVIEDVEMKEEGAE